MTKNYEIVNVNMYMLFMVIRFPRIHVDEKPNNIISHVIFHLIN